MKRFVTVVLTLCIALMCTTPFEAQSQNRRTGGGNSGDATKKEQPTRSSGSSATTATTATRSSEPKTKMVTPSGQTSRQNAPSRGNAQAAPQQKQQKQSAPPAQVQDRRPNNGNTQNSGSHSAQISRKNSDVGRQNIPDRKPDVKKPKDNDRNKYNDPYYNRPRDHKPAAVQYHNQPPKPRGPEYTRPYLEPRHAPIPSYRYGDHYFGYRLNTLPRGYVVMRVGGLDYYYYDGIYYRPYLGGGYYVCRPPRGTSIASTMLNVALTAIAINTIRNEIERAQRAAELSRAYANRNTGYVLRTSDYYNTNLTGQLNQDYYYQDGVFYILKNGQYYVIEAPIGALVTEIPSDYDEIELDGRIYYLVEDTLYKATVIDGALYFEVVCNL